MLTFLTTFVILPQLVEINNTGSTLWRYVVGPLFEVRTYKKYRINGFVFSPQYHDQNVVTQDSGVCMKAITTFVSSAKDPNGKDAWTMWYGVIRHIMQLEYAHDMHVVVFYCDWVKVEDKTNGCKLNHDSSLVMVNLNKLKSIDKITDEPFILASEASQVFYSKDLKNEDWWVVIHSPKRLSSLVDDLEIPRDYKSNLEDQPHSEQPISSVFQSTLEDQPHLKNLLPVL